MRRITLWLLSTISALVLLFSYHTSTNAAATTSVVKAATDTQIEADASATAGSAASASGSSAASADASATASASASTQEPAATPSASASASADSATTTVTAATYDGTAISTRYGPVQVQITVEAGKITKAIVLQVPWNNPKDQQINAAAVPILNNETVSAQSASIDMVSGATYTSAAYIQSLQSALDQAHLS